MRTADRITAGQAATYSAGEPSAMAEFMRSRLANLPDDVRKAQRFVADNVAQFVRGHTFVLDEMPCLAPPYPQMFFEYPNETGRERRGVMVSDVTGAGADQFFAFIKEAALQDAEKNGFYKPPRWILMFEVWLDASGQQASARPDAQVIGPFGWLVMALDANGRFMGNRWVTTMAAGKFLDSTEHGPELVLLAMIAPAMQAIAFLHCRNIVTDRHAPPEKLAHRHRKRHGAAMLKYSTIRLEVPRKQGGGGASNAIGETALHIVAGNFHHYGDCCPGVHEPHGKLFGRLEGVYWVPSHIRGNPDRGIKVTDRDLITEGL